MKKKQNLLLLVLAVLFVSLFSGSTAVSAASFPRLEIAKTGEIVSKKTTCIIVTQKEIMPEINICVSREKTIILIIQEKPGMECIRSTAENITLESVQRDICTETVCSVTTRIITT